MMNRMLMFSLGLVAKLAALGAVFCFGAYLVLKAPQMHGDYLRDKVGSKVIKLINEDRNSGGTGFLVEGASGKVYVLTNAHVCGRDGEKVVYAEVPNAKRAITLRILEVASNTDLCILEAPKFAEKGLKLASSVRPGQEIAVIGHPRLMQVTLSRGQIIGDQVIPMLAHFGQCEVEDENHKTFMTLFGPVCAMLYKAQATNVLILGGNSGSPAVDFFGNVVGVAFAAAQDNWGLIIKLEEVREFLSVY